MSVAVTVPAPDDLLAAVRGVVAGAEDALLCVAFVNEAGVNLIAPALEPRRRSVRLLSTTVFGDTTAAALERAADLGVEVRVLNLPRGTYHPKLYLAQRGGQATALVGSANLTSGLLRNVEVAALLSGCAEDAALARLWEMAEGWWAHPAAATWTPGLPAPRTDAFLDDLWAQLSAVLESGDTIRTLVDQRPNRIVELTRSALWIETDRSRRLGRGAEPVPAWMFNVAWDYLAAHGALSNRFLLAGDGLNVKRSSAVCAVLACLPAVAVRSRRPIVLTLATPAAGALAAEPPASYDR